MRIRIPTIITSRQIYVLLLLVCFSPAITHSQTVIPDEYVDSRIEDLVTIAASRDGKLVAIARSNSDPIRKIGWVELWNGQTGTLVRTIMGFEGPIWSISFSPDGRTLVTGSTEFRDLRASVKARSRKGAVVGDVKWWDTATGEFQRRYSWPDDETITVGVTFSPNGRDVAVAARHPRGGNELQGDFADLDLALVDAQTGLKKASLASDPETTTGRWNRVFDPFIYSPDGSRLAALSSGRVEVWSSDGKRLHTLKDFYGYASAIAFSRDGKLLAIASTSLFDRLYIPDSEVTVWDLATRHQTVRLRVRWEKISTVQFVENNRTLLIGSLRYMKSRQDPHARTVGTLKSWDLSTNSVVAKELYKALPVKRVETLPDRSWLVVQSGLDVELRSTQNSRVIRLQNLQGDEEVSARGQKRFLLSLKRIESVSFSQDGKLVLGQVSDEGVNLWNTATGELKSTIPRNSDSLPLFALSSAGRAFVEVTPEKIRITDPVTGRRRELPLEPKRTPSLVSVSPDGSTIALVENETIIIRGSNADSRNNIIDAHDHQIEFLSFSGDGNTFASGDESGTIKIWDVGREDPRIMITTGRRLTALAIDQQSKHVAAAFSDSNVIGVWEPGSTAMLLSLKEHKKSISALVFSSDGTMLASGGDDQFVVLWNLRSGKRRRTLKGHDYLVTSLAFSPTDELLASGSGNNSLLLWNVSTGKVERILR